MKNKNLRNKIENQFLPGKSLTNIVQAIENSWKLLPIAGYFDYSTGGAFNSSGWERDKIKGVPLWKRVAKYSFHVLNQVAFTTYVVLVVSTGEFNPIKIPITMQEQAIQQRNEEIKKEKLRTYKRSLTDFVDSDKNGLSFKEDYQIKELMKIQNKSKEYIPTFEDWQRGYNNIKNTSKKKIYSN